MLLLLLLLLQSAMEQVLECFDGYCSENDSIEVKHVPAQTCSQNEILDNSELGDACTSGICSSLTTVPVLHDDKEIYESHVQDRTVPSLPFVAVVDSDVYVYDSSTSVIRSLSDVLSNSINFHVEDKFTRGENLTTVTTCGDRNVSKIGHSTSQLHVHDGNEQGDKQQSTNFLSCTTFLSCKTDVLAAARVSLLSLLASRVKALCKIITTEGDNNKVLKMALFSTNLKTQFRNHSPLPNSICYRDLFVADVFVSCGQGKTKKMAKRHARSNAVSSLLRPYLHLEQSSLSDKTLSLVASETPSVTESYDIVTTLDVTSSDLCLPILDVVNCSEQQMRSVKMNQLVVCLNHVISMVRTLLHVLKTVRNKDVINTAVHNAKLPIKLQIATVSRQQFCCSLFIDVVLVAFTEASTRTRVTASAYASAVEIFCKPYLRLEGSGHGGLVRLVGSEEPFDVTPYGTLSSPQNDKNDKLDPEETRFVFEKKSSSCACQNSELPAANEGAMNSPCPTSVISAFSRTASQNDKNDKLDPEETRFVFEKKSPSCACQNSELPAANVRAKGAMYSPYPTSLLSTADLPAVMACFQRLSNKVKALFSDTAVAKSAAAVMTSALNAMKLPSHPRVIRLPGGRGFHCDLQVVSVHVASGEAAGRVNARDEAYMNAAELLQKPHLRLAVGRDRSTVLVGSDEPFVEASSAFESQQGPDIALVSPAAVDPVVHEKAEITKDHSGLLVPGSQNSPLLDTDNNEICPADTSSTMLVEKQKPPNMDSSEIVCAGSELPYATSTFLNQPHVNVTGNKPDIRAKSSDDSVSEQEVMECQKTVVIARSSKDLSRLVNRFRSLADIAKDICAMFKSTKSSKDMVQMAVHMSHMCSKTDIVKVRVVYVHCQLLIDDVVVAVAEDCKRKSTTIMAYGIAAKVLCMPYLCLDEKHGHIQLLGSEEPFIELSLEPDDVKVNSSPSRGFWLNSSTVNADEEGKKDLPQPYTADLSKLLVCFHDLGCKLQALSKSGLQINGIDMMQRVLHKTKMCLSARVVRVVDVGSQCELFIDGVEIASCIASRKKQAKHAAHNAAVDLLQKPYLRLQENPETNRSFKLIGSEQPFIGVSSGVLPCDEICLSTDEGQVNESPRLRANAYSDEWHSADSKTYDSGKPGTETCLESSSSLSLANDDEPADESGLYETQISALACSVDVSELLKEFRALACRVKCISRSSLEVCSDTDIMEMALTDTRMQKRRLIIWVDSIAFRCELSVDGISIAYGEGDTKEEAKQAAYSAAVELLGKPYLQLQENPGFWRSYKLVGSDETFAAVPSNVVSSYKQKSAVTDKRRDRKKRTPDYQHGVTDKSVADPAGGKDSLLQKHFETVPVHGLTDFVILRNHVKKQNCMDILQQSADFNSCSLIYDLSGVEGRCRCRLMLDSQTLGDAVMQTNKSAKKAAAEQALNCLVSMCYTVKMKKFDILTNCMTRREV